MQKCSNEVLEMLIPYLKTPDEVAGFVPIHGAATHGAFVIGHWTFLGPWSLRHWAFPALASS